MNKYWHSAISLVLISVGLFHLLMTFVYLVPSNLVGQKLGGISSHYMHDRFEQNWHLFSPNPGFVDTSLWIKCANEDGNFTEWKDPFQKLLNYHQKTRVTGVGKLLYVYENLGRTLKHEARAASEVISDWCSEEPKRKNRGLHSLRTQYQNMLIPETHVSLCTEKGQKELTDKLVKMSKKTGFARQFASQYCHENSPESIAFQIRVVETTPKRFSERFEKKTYGDVNIIDFDAELILASQP